MLLQTNADTPSGALRHPKRKILRVRLSVVLVFDLNPESEWGEPGPPTADPGQLGPCMCTPRRHR